MDYEELLGKLPERIENHVKNDLAKNKFGELFSDPLFIVRDETDNDYGVDICIEAIVNSGKSPTNIRAHVQLKSSAKAENVTGGYSYSVGVTNLNYLVNLQNSFYAFYSVKENRFYYAYADEIYIYYKQLSSDWNKQVSITIHFSNILDAKAVKLIHSRLLEDTILFKDIRLKMRENGIEPGTKFVYGNLVFETSTEKFNNYQEEHKVSYMYSIDENGKVIFMHNLLWESHYGIIPNGYHVYHVNGNTLDNRSENLDILKTVETFDLEGFQRKIEEEQAYNILSMITDGTNAEFRDVPPPVKVLFNKVISELKQKGWGITVRQLKNLQKNLGMID